MPHRRQKNIHSLETQGCLCCVQEEELRISQRHRQVNAAKNMGCDCSDTIRRCFIHSVCEAGMLCPSLTLCRNVQTLKQGFDVQETPVKTCQSGRSSGRDNAAAK